MLLEGATTDAYTPPPAIHECADRAGSNAPSIPRWETGSFGATEAQLAISAPDDPFKQYEAKRAAEIDSYINLLAEMTARIRELVTDAVMAHEPVSQDSLSDFRLFMRQVSFGRRPAIYLLGNGNFRAVWKNADNEQAAFQFRGNGIVHCVFFRRRKAPQMPLNSETLIDLLPNVRARLSDFEHLLRG